MAFFVGFVSFFSPLVSVPLLVYSFWKVKWFDKKYAFPFAMIYGAVAYSVHPTGEIDLVRYFAIIEQMEGQSLAHVLLNNYDLLYVRDILFYLVARTGDVHILPFITTTFVYFVAFYVSFDSFTRLKLYESRYAKQYQLLITFFSISLIWTLNVISNVRNILAFMMIAFACYRELCEKKKGLFTWFLYIVPIGLHVSAVVLLLIRILLPVIQKRKFFLLGAIAFPIPVEFAYQILSRINNNNVIVVILKNMVNKAHYYLNWNSGGWADVVNNSIKSYLERTYIAVVFVCFILLLIYVVPKANREFSKIDSFLYAVSVVTLGCLYITTGALWRFEAVVVFLSGIITASAIKYGNKKVHLLITFLFASSFVYFGYNFVRFFAYVSVKDLFNEFVLFSGAGVLIKLIGGIIGVIG